MKDIDISMEEIAAFIDDAAETVRRYTHAKARMVPHLAYRPLSDEEREALRQEMRDAYAELRALSAEKRAGR